MLAGRGMALPAGREQVRLIDPRRRITRGPDVMLAVAVGAHRRRGRSGRRRQLVQRRRDPVELLTVALVHGTQPVLLNDPGGGVAGPAHLRDVVPIRAARHPCRVVRVVAGRAQRDVIESHPHGPAVHALGELLCPVGMTRLAHRSRLLLKLPQCLDRQRGVGNLDVGRMAGRTRQRFAVR